MAEPILNIENLVVHYETRSGVAEAVNNVNLKIYPGETLGLVGETGAGKTTIALSIMGLLPKPAGHIVQGKIEVDGEDIVPYMPNNRKANRLDKHLRALPHTVFIFHICQLRVSAHRVAQPHAAHEICAALFMAECAHHMLMTAEHIVRFYDI